MTRWTRVAFVGFGFGLTVAGASVGLTACSSKSSGGGAGPTSCPSQALEILFNPMYSAYDGQHTFEIPAIVNGLVPGAVSWSASDPSMVQFASDTDTGGTLITVQQAGTVQIIASAGSLCGSAPLTITPATPDDWTVGNARYNNGTALHFGPGHGGMGGDGGSGDGGGPACTNCHGPTANNPTMGFNDIAHTPEQTGGFSDNDLINIVVNGNVPGWNADGAPPDPDAGYFDDSILSYRQWHSFHHWTDITMDEQLGIVVYLRSLAPSAQNGSANFGGRNHDGGFGHHEGGGGGGGGGGGDGGGAPSDAGGGGD